MDDITEWLRVNGASTNTINEVEKLRVSENEYDISTQQDESETLRELQSASSKLTNVNRQVAVADDKVKAAQQFLDDEIDKRNEVLEKRQTLLDKVDALKSSLAGSARNDANAQSDRSQAFETILQSIAEKIQFGIPASDTKERSELYDLIFNVPRSQPQTHAAASAEASAPQGPAGDAPPPAGGSPLDKDDDDTIKFVDREGFGFGPASGPKPEEPSLCGTGKGKTQGGVGTPY